MQMFDAGKTRMIGLPYHDMLSRFHLVPERNGRSDRRRDRQLDRQTDRQMDRFAISISRVSMLMRNKNPTYV